MMYGPAATSAAVNSWSAAESCLDHADEANAAKEMAIAKIMISTDAYRDEKTRGEGSSAYNQAP